MATYSPVSAVVGVQSRFCRVCQGEGVQGRDWGGFCGSLAMPDVGEGVQSMQLG
eukprot:COSAG01_NODE_18781_length_1053_cov_3.518868_3_plen_53_part_01